MSHRIYTTSGFVVESRPYGEAGKILSIFTRDLGMVNAAAQGIRLVQSKLRYHAQDFSLAEFSLVRGRDLWRVVGAESLESARSVKNIGREIVQKDAADISGSPDPLFVRMLTVLRRLVQGEEKNEALFDMLIAAHDFLLKNNPAEEKKMADMIEPVIMLRILHHLGYIRMNPHLALFLVDNSFSDELIEKMSDNAVRTIAIKEINKALQESHL